MPTDGLSGLLIGHDWYCSDEFSSSASANILASHQLSDTGALVQDGYAYTLKSNKLTETKFSGDSKKTSHLFQSTTGAPPKAGKTADVGGDKDACGNFNPPGGPWLYKELSGTKKPTSNAKKSLGGFERHYNSCTQTVLDIFLRNFPDSSPLNQSYLEKHQPFIFNPETRSLISYNDPTSFRAKAKFVLRHGLSGVEVFNATGDTDDNILLRSVRKVLA
ncbi:hypothetical protein BY996DRAFT_8687592 [Phakopsora pachyrhizi]|nr:hypothetical protein BY996DRAFT_8687592 [Phakopsora pachyrhizi]